MLKSLFATCLTALSVNTQPLAVSPSIEPSMAISEGTTFNVGDNVILSVACEVVTSDNYSPLMLLDPSDNGVNQLKILDFTCDYHIVINSVSTPLFLDYAMFSYSILFSSNSATLYFEGDTDIDNNISFEVYLDENINIFNYSFTFQILEGFQGFHESALPYLTKVETPYTPPAKSNLYRLLYDFYYSIFNDDDLTTISTGYNMPFDNWLAHTCTIATLITLIVVAFFFLRWLFKVISGLILLKR